MQLFGFQTLLQTEMQRTGKKGKTKAGTLGVNADRTSEYKQEQWENTWVK